MKVSTYRAPDFCRTEPPTVAVALTVAGSDSSGGAGIKADLKTFTSLGVFGTVALTAVTAQNTLGVPGVRVLDPDFVVAQLDAVLTDVEVGAAKTGMLANSDIIEAVGGCVKRYSVSNLVVDPVMVSKTGAPLMEQQARDALVRRLLPLATVITPNIPEAEAILGVSIKTMAEARLAVVKLREMGPEWVVVKGGHLQERVSKEGRVQDRPEDSPEGSADSVDIAFNGSEFIELSAKRYATRNTHGTGCTYSAAITAYLALGMGVPEALRAAKDYITWAVANSLSLGRGCGPTNHFYFRSVSGSGAAGAPEEV